MQKFLLTLKNLSKYLVAAFLIIIPLYPKFPFLKIPGTYVSIRLEDFLMILLALLVFLKIIPDIKNIAKDKIVRAIFLFLLVGFISLLSAILITKTITPHIGFLHFIRRIEYFVPFFAGYLLFRGDKDRKNVLEFFVKCLMIVIVISFIYGVGQRYLSWPVIITQNEEYSKGIALKWVPGSHISSTFAGHYDLATFLILVLPIVISTFFVFQGRWTKVVLAMTVLCGLWLLTNSVSRISVVSYLISSILALLLIGKYKEIFLVVFISLVFFLTSAPLMGRYLNLGVYAREETPAPVVEDRSTSIRFNVEWPRALRAFFKNPLLGTGYSSITLATDNDFLRLIGEVGIIGLVTFVLLLGRIFFSFIGAFPLNNNFSGLEMSYLSGIIGAFPGVLLNSLFIDVFEASKFVFIFWFLIGFALFLIRNRQYE